MEWFIAVLAILVLGVAAMAAAGGVGEMSRDAIRDVYRQQLPDRPLTADDLRKARFGVALRGYSMAQVDDLLDRLGNEIAVRDARIAELTQRIQPDAPYAPASPNAAEVPYAAEVSSASEVPYASDVPSRAASDRAGDRRPSGERPGATDGTDAGWPEPIGRRASGWTPDE